MELVYLWVEDYKNIHEQGFNFSPRFECKYENNELTIIEKKEDEYIKDFFGKNINITAIVGKNGSGKSSLFKLILKLINKQAQTDIGIKPINNFLIIFKDGIYKYLPWDKEIRANNYFINIRNLKTNIVSRIIQPSINEMNFFTIYLNYMLDTLFDGDEDTWLNNLYHKSDNYEIPILLEPRKNNSRDNRKFNQTIDLDGITYLNNQNLLRFYKDISNEAQIKGFFSPNKVSLILKKEKIIDKFKYFQKSPYRLDLEEIKFQTFVNNCIQKRDYRTINLLYIILKIYTSWSDYFNERVSTTILNNFKEIIKEDFSNIEEFYNNNIQNRNLFNESVSGYKIEKIKKCIKFHEEKTYDNILFQKGINQLVELKDIKSILTLIPSWIEVEFYENEKSIKSLSSGEKTFFTFMLNILSHITNISVHDEYKTINLFLDETELGLHPEWQRVYIDKVLKVLSNISYKKINIIFATHSPFIISDLPKENVIFLEDGKQDKGVRHEQTFGANIHTLLSDSFFMEDGLMGEFAKNKIRTIKVAHRYILHRDKRKTLFTQSSKRCRRLLIKQLAKFRQIQEIIGEPFLQKIVKNQLEEMELILLGKNEAIDNEIARLQALKASLR